MIGTLPQVIGIETLQSLNDIEAQIQTKYAEAPPAETQHANEHENAYNAFRLRREHTTRPKNATVICSGRTP